MPLVERGAPGHAPAVPPWGAGAAPARALLAAGRAGPTLKHTIVNNSQMRTFGKTNMKQKPLASLFTKERLPLRNWVFCQKTCSTSAVQTLKPEGPTCAELVAPPWASAAPAGLGVLLLMGPATLGATSNHLSWLQGSAPRLDLQGLQPEAEQEHPQQLR